MATVNNIKINMLRMILDDIKPKFPKLIMPFICETDNYIKIYARHTHNLIDTEDGPISLSRRVGTISIDEGILFINLLNKISPPYWTDVCLNLHDNDVIYKLRTIINMFIDSGPRVWETIDNENCFRRH